MNRVGWVIALVAAGCTKPNPLYCDENTDCNVGTTCDLSTHGCIDVVDAPLADQLSIDAPRIVTSVRELRDPSVPEETFVELSSVIVTAIDSYGTSGEIWVQDQGGGLGAGVRVAGGITSVVDALVVGDLVDITNARKQGTESTGVAVRQQLHEILQLTKLGTSATPTTTPVDVAALATLDPSQLAGELHRWDGTLVVVQHVLASSAPDPVYETFSIGPLEITSRQAQMPTGIDTGTCLMSVTGVIEHYGAYWLTPRSTAEVVIGSGCN